MGCCFSFEPMFDDELYTYLTRREMRLIQKTWVAVNKNLPLLEHLVFKKLFEMRYELKSLFGKLMVRDNNGELQINEEELETHAGILMEALGSVVESLGDTSLLTQILIRIGEKHTIYQVEAETVQCFWPAIRETLRETLKDQFSPDVESAWNHVFEYIASKFMEGIVTAQERQQ